MYKRQEFRRDGLILAGDVSSRFSILRETLELCKRAFADVSFVPGNHDVWVTRGEPWQDSLSKLRAVDALCDELGVHRTPAIMGGCVVAPLCAWHHAAFDREPEVTGWAGLPPASQVISDFYLCKFPGLSQTDDSVAEALDARNGDVEGAIAALRRAQPTLPLVTFSHFVPRPELVPEKRYLFVPALAKAVGSTFLERRVARLKPDVHVFCRADLTCHGARIRLTGRFAHRSSATPILAGTRRSTALATSRRAWRTLGSAATGSPPSPPSAAPRTRRTATRAGRAPRFRSRRRRCSSERAARSCRATGAAGAPSTT